MVEMISDQRFYERRAAEELKRAARALSPQAKDWHRKLARDFAKRAQEQAEANPEVHDAGVR